VDLGLLYLYRICRCLSLAFSCIAYRTFLYTGIPDSYEGGEEQRAVYLAKAKNNVDENTVTQLTDASDLDAGKKVFTTTCAACHAADGGGT
jgi:mono/diheme cytochrome c family protein